MTLRRALPGFCILCLLLMAIPAVAQQDLYNNGPIDGESIGWTINFGFAVSDQFTLSSDSTINGITFAAHMFPGDVLETVDVSITSSEFGGTSYFDQTVSFTQLGSCFVNDFGFNVCTESGAFGNVSLNAGSYWLNLQNGVVNTGDPVFWDENSGPSLASESSVGTIPSESFTILGRSTGTGTTPEPSSLLLFASGIVGIFAAIHHRFSA
ncbi:MAG TPA: PEP-CTERM sorting domain-containing protein [Terriglobales bacterium]